MKYEYLVANGAWAFTFGDSIIQLDGWDRFFYSRQMAKYALNGLGLRLTNRNTVKILGGSNVR